MITMFVVNNQTASWNKNDWSGYTTLVGFRVDSICLSQSRVQSRNVISPRVLQKARSWKENSSLRRNWLQRREDWTAPQSVTIVPDTAPRKVDQVEYLADLGENDVWRLPTRWHYDQGPDCQGVGRDVTQIQLIFNPKSHRLQQW